LPWHGGQHSSTSRRNGCVGIGNGFTGYLQPLAGAGVALIIHFAEDPKAPWPPAVLVSALAWVFIAYVVIDYHVIQKWGVHAERRDNLRTALNGPLNYLVEEVEHRYAETSPVANIMVPCGNRRELEVFACSQDMQGTALAGSVFPLGKGLVGGLWQSGLDLAFDVFRAPDDHAAYALDERAVRLHEHITCVISVAIREGFGRQQRLLGFLNLHSATDQARSTWLATEDEDPTSTCVSPGLVALLLQTRDYVAPRLSPLV